MITVYNSLTVNDHTVHILDIKAANKPRVLTCTVHRHSCNALLLIKVIFVSLML